MQLVWPSQLFATALLVLAFVYPSGASAQAKVRLAHTTVEASSAVWYVAREAGLYKKNGLDVELLFIPNTPTSVASLIAGDVHVGNASGGGVASAAVAGADLVMVGCYLNSLPFGGGP